MARIKVTLLFNSTRSPAGSVIGGWSESYYTLLPGPISGLRHIVDKDINSLRNVRRGLLHKAYDIIGARIVDEENPGPVVHLQFHRDVGRGLQDTTGAEQPWTSLLIRNNTVFFHRRMQVLRGLPWGVVDSQAADDNRTSLQFSPAFETAFNAFRTMLVGETFLFAVRTRPLVAAAFDITTLTVPDGQSFVATVIAPGFVAAVGDKVRLSRVARPYNADGEWKIEARAGAADPFTYTLRRLSTAPVAGIYDGTGRIRQVLYELERVGDIVPKKLVARDTGRPFGSRRGSQTRTFK